ncbi:hypothetical protein CIPAW_13G158300 [Carya illinoinensis]|uniref:Uncharacterized protein n=1 Tax=Carya illinoinensis TaxID=32201 RepID=A0A8T1NUL6_CARIL|nr:hypothetical protein CIPAW_13G158300 [Carya illinoinensis]KAG6632421.1 hypothetical protein CIPAW_13G158300 [Carya illinoinensis]KAG6682719.1 hypothetical protein I3842_13G156500 [Carya illinoinensis]
MKGRRDLNQFKNSIAHIGKINKASYSRDASAFEAPERKKLRLTEEWSLLVVKVVHQK